MVDTFDVPERVSQNGDIDGCEGGLGTDYHELKGIVKRLKETNVSEDERGKLLARKADLLEVHPQLEQYL